MNEVLAWLLDLDTLQWGAENVRFGFERPLPMWAWPGVAMAAIAFAVWSYSRLTGSGAGRGVLAALRGLLLILIAALIAGPQLVRVDETIERDWVIALVDRSASMTIADAPGPPGPAGAEASRTTREEQLREAVRKSWPMWSSLAESRTVVWMGFDAGAFDLRDAAGAVDLGEPGGRRTSLASALEQAIRRAAARPLSSVVIFSDGRSIDEPSRAALRSLRAERVPVHVVPLGSPDPIGDLAIRRAEGPGMAFVGDVAPVTVDLERLGGSAQAGGTLRLTDASTGIVLDEKRIEPGESGADASAAGAEQTITLTSRPTDPGQATWVVELVPDGADLIAGNNRAEIAIELIDRPLRTLYVDGYPRWEQRYLRNFLIREQSITSSNLMLSPALRPSQEGDIELDALPDSPEQWAAFDVVILGDVHPEVFTRKQLEDLREHVSLRGGGLLWIAGQGSMPDAWWGTPLADLIPFDRAALPTGLGMSLPVLAVPTPLAERFGVMRLAPSEESAWPEELTDPATGWSTIRWMQQIDPGGLKPTAEIIAHAVPTSLVNGPEDAAIVSASAGGTGEAWPLAISMRYGAGRVLYVATDETWRWRYGRGELLYERFWLQFLRLLGREAMSRSGRSATLVIDPERAVVDQPVRVAVELMDQSLVEIGLASVGVRLTRRPAPGETEPAQPVELVLRPDGKDRLTFSATWLPPEAGHWQAQTAESALAGLALTAEAEVSLPDDELRRPESDHALLARLSAETGGKVVAPEDLMTLGAELPNRRVRLVSETAEPLWDTPLALLTVIVLLTGEWVGRRLLRLI